jgi:hypothetical protein
VKINVSYTLEIDPLIWNENYGYEIHGQRLREAVREHIRSDIAGLPCAEFDGITSVTRTDQRVNRAREARA